MSWQLDRLQLYENSQVLQRGNYLTTLNIPPHSLRFIGTNEVVLY